MTVSCLTKANTIYEYLRAVSHKDTKPEMYSAFELCYLWVVRASRNCALTLPAETAITIACTAPISSSLNPCSLATPK